MPKQRPEEFIAFWRDAGSERWFRKDAAFDAEIRAQFLDAHEQATAGQRTDWQQTPEGALALLLLLDQFPRNMFRGTARMFATDSAAVEVARLALADGFDTKIPEAMRTFFYLPFMHSERLEDQQRALELYAGTPDGLKWANMHADVIRRFGRFPHRNALLGRLTTPKEQAFLDAGGFAG